MHVRVGVAAIIINHDQQILLGKRINAHGHQTWAPPGGHLEFNESPIECAIRETREETGIEICNVSAGPWTNDIFAEQNKHYITLFMIANHYRGDARCLEPDKCTSWQWFSWEHLPQPLFLSFKNLLLQGHNIKSLLG